MKKIYKIFNELINLDSLLLLLLSLSLLIAPLYFGLVTTGGKLILSVILTLALIMICVKFWRIPYILLGNSLLSFFVTGFIIVALFSYLYSPFFVSLNIFQSFLLSVLGYFIFLIYLNKKKCEFLFHIFVIIGTWLALFGLMSFIWHKYDLFFYTKKFYQTRLSATYLNPNHFATFLNFVIPFNYFFILKRRRYTRFFYCISLLIMFVALIFTKSFAALIAAIIGLLFFASLINIKFKLISSAKLYIYLFLFLLIPFIYFDFLAKLYSFSVRYSIIKAAINVIYNMFSEFPLLFIGYGGGLFRFIYGGYHFELTSTIIEYLHNDYLQLLIEYGVVGLFFFTALIVYPFYRYIKNKGNSQISLVHITLLTVFLQFAIHLFFDFNLYITANCFYFFVLLAFYEIYLGRVRLYNKKMVNFFVVLICIISITLTFSLAKVFISERFVAKAIVLYKHKNYDDSESLFFRALRLEPTDIDIYTAFAEMYQYYALEKIDKVSKEKLLYKSEKLLLKAFTLNPNDIYLIVRLANFYNYNDDLGQAEYYYKLAVSKNEYLIPPREKLIEFYCLNSEDKYMKIIYNLNFLVANMKNHTFQNSNDKRQLFDSLVKNLRKTGDSRLIEFAKGLNP